MNSLNMIINAILKKFRTKKVIFWKIAKKMTIVVLMKMPPQIGQNFEVIFVVMN